MSYTVRLSSVASNQTDEISDWWAEDRDRSPTLVEDELARALTLLADAPQIGARVRHPARPRRAEVRRLLLRTSGFHVYYAVDHRAEVVEGLAVWHGARRKGSRL